VVTPNFCPNTTSATLTFTGITPPMSFATLTKNTDGSFSIALSSSDPLITGETYIFTLSFFDSSGASFTQLTSPSFYVVVKLPSVDCSVSGLSNLNYSVTDTIDIHVPACIITPYSLSD
jgi:hypothetical protein